MTNSTRQGFTTKASLAEAAGVSANTITRWSRRPDFPSRGAGGWDRAGFLRYAQIRLEKAASVQTGVNSDLKATKLRRQIDLIAVQIRKAKHDLAESSRNAIPLAEHNATILEIAGIVKEGLNNWVQRVEARGDAKLAGWARETTDAALNAISDKAEEKAAASSTDSE